MLYTNRQIHTLDPIEPLKMKVTELNDFASFNEQYEQFRNKQVANPSDPPLSLLVLFEASDDPGTQKSWCSDCAESKPIIDKVLEDFKFNEQLALLVVKVGNRDEWKSNDNPFRNHDLRITNVPTLVSLKTVSLVANYQ